MKILKQAIGFAAVGALVAGGVVVSAPAGNSVVTTVATCSGQKGIGSAKSTTIGDGLTDSDNQDVSISIKGVDPNTNGGTNLGTCTYASGQGVHDGSKPPVNYSGTKTLAKWGVKLFSPEADCNSVDTGDTTEWPINGKFSVAYTDLQKADAWTIVEGFSDPDNDPSTPSDVVESHGIVIKGVAAGADTNADLYFSPAVKDKTQTTNTPHFGYQFDLLNAAGCADDQIGPNANNANVTALVTGQGTSQLLSLPAAGLSLTKGTP